MSRQTVDGCGCSLACAHNACPAQQDHGPQQPPAGEAAAVQLCTSSAWRAELPPGGCIRASSSTAARHAPALCSCLLILKVLIRQVQVVLIQLSGLSRTVADQWQGVCRVSGCGRGGGRGAWSAAQAKSRHLAWPRRCTSLASQSNTLLDNPAHETHRRGHTPLHPLLQLPAPSAPAPAAHPHCQRCLRPPASTRRGCHTPTNINLHAQVGWEGPDACA
jgi:hypothetical protein